MPMASFLLLREVSSGRPASHSCLQQAWLPSLTMLTNTIICISRCVCHRKTCPQDIWSYQCPNFIVDKKSDTTSLCSVGLPCDITIVHCRISAIFFGQCANSGQSASCCTIRYQYLSRRQVFAVIRLASDKSLATSWSTCGVLSWTCVLHSTAFFMRRAKIDTWPQNNTHACAGLQPNVPV